MSRISKLDISDYNKCNAIWDMKACPYTEKFRKEIELCNRVVFVYIENEGFIAEISYVFETNDNDYTIPNQRLYLSRLIVKREYRNIGIGSELIDFVIEKAKNMGYQELSVGINKDNKVALHLYKKKGFTEVIFDGADSDGEYYKLLRKL